MAGVTLDTDLSQHVRDITDDEIAFYRENGWVKLDGLISSTLSAELLQAALELLKQVKLMTPDSTTQHSNMGETFSMHSNVTDDWNVHWGELAFQARYLRIEPFLSLTMSQQLGRLAQKLINRERLTGRPVPVRYRSDTLLCKPPVQPGGVSNATPYHQDPPNGIDRVGGAAFWIALDEIRPEQGAMRFLTGSHREGPLGLEQDFLGHYAGLEEVYEWSPPLHYLPGDATVHQGDTVHGGPANTGDRPRWSFVAGYMSADCVVPDRGPHTSEGLLGMPEPHERFPIVYP